VAAVNTEGIAAGCLGTRNEGWFDPWALLRGMRQRASSMGVRFVDGVPRAATRDASGEAVATVAVEMRGDNDATATLREFQPRCVVNAAGAHARAVVDLLGGEQSVSALPVSPRKRVIFYVRCQAADAPTADTTPMWEAPLTVDPSGVYFRPEGRGSRDAYLCGVSPDASRDDEVKDGGGLEVSEADHRELFEEVIWPAMYERAPAFGALKVQSAWAGLYEYNTLDQNALIGWHPELRNVMLVNGFSGHGLQQAPAAGRAAAELVEHDRFVSLDLSIFDPARTLEGGQPVFETGIV